MTVQEVLETLLVIQCSNKELTPKQVDALAIANDLIKRAKLEFIECIEREKFNDKNIITVQTREYGSVEVIPVDTIADIESADIQSKDSWINARENPPKIGEQVLVSDKFKQIDKMTYKGNGLWSRNDFTYKVTEKLFWQPLPEPPETKKG